MTDINGCQSTWEFTIACGAGDLLSLDNDAWSVLVRFLDARAVAALLRTANSLRQEPMFGRIHFFGRTVFQAQEQL